MSYSAEELFNLLPAVYRVRDAEKGELRALIEILAREASVVDAGIEQMYSDWFIETCQPWVAPYIGDLIGATPLHSVSTKTMSTRAYVANTLGYRRRSGTLAALEQSAADVSGWATTAVEEFQFLGWTQFMNHLRLSAGGMWDVRDSVENEKIGGPLDPAPHTVDVRNIASGRGRYNIPNIALHLYRLSSYPTDWVSAQSTGVAGQYLLQPAGLPLPLFNSDGRERTIEHLATESDLPASLRRFALFRELENRRQAIVDTAETLPAVFFNDTEPLLRVRYRLVNGTVREVPLDEIRICNLETWPAVRPAASRSYTPSRGGAPVAMPITVAVDPQIGRAVFATGIDPVAVECRYYYGFPAEIGGGSYERKSPESTATWTVQGNADLQTAVTAWNARPAGTSERIEIVNSLTYDLAAVGQIRLKNNSRLVITASRGQRPFLSGSLEFRGTAAASSASPGGVLLDGLYIGGSISVAAGNIGDFELRHCTIAGEIRAIENDRLDLRLERVISGAVRITGSAAGCALTESILTGPLEAEMVPANVESCTIDGIVHVARLEASNTIFLGAVDCERRQEGCVRFSYIPRNSRIPQQFRCQPALAIGEATGAEAARIRARVVPSFTTRTYPKAAFYQLSASAPIEIRTGAEDGAEMGVYRFLNQPQRERNVRTVAAEYLRAGLEAGVFYAT